MERHLGSGSLCFELQMYCTEPGSHSDITQRFWKDMHLHDELEWGCSYCSLLKFMSVIFLAGKSVPLMKRLRRYG